MDTLLRKIGSVLIDFYDTMKNLESVSDTKEREGKKATKLIMTINDYESIIMEEAIEFTRWQNESQTAANYWNKNRIHLQPTMDGSERTKIDKSFIELYLLYTKEKKSNVGA